MMTWGTLLWLVILPVTQMSLLRYVSSGFPNFGRSVPQITIVNISLGCGLSRFRKVGWPLLPETKRVLAALPHTVTVAPT